MTRRTLPLLAAVAAAATLLAGCSSEQAAPSTTAAATTSTTAVCAPPDTGTVAAEQLTVPPGSTQSEWVVTSFDGTTIRAHWFPLAGASAENPAPTVLMGPGWGLAGDTDPDGVGILGAMSIGGLQKAGFRRSWAACVVAKSHARLSKFSAALFG